MEFRSLYFGLYTQEDYLGGGGRDKNVGCCYKGVEVAWNRYPERIKRPKIYPGWSIVYQQSRCIVRIFDENENLLIV